jgi:hypothetical protein
MAKELKKGLEKFGELAAKFMKETLSSKGKDATGNLMNNIKVEVDSKNDVQDIIIEMPDYGQYVDSGRKPGGKFPPPPAIKNWIKDKPIRVRGISIDSAAYLIGKKISEKGIEPTPFIEQSIERAFEQGEDLVLDALENDVAFTIEAAFKNTILK